MSDTPRTVWWCGEHQILIRECNDAEPFNNCPRVLMELHPVGTHQELAELRQMLAYHEEPRE